MAEEKRNKKLQEPKAMSEAEKLPMEDLEQVVGGLTTENGNWITTVAFGCEKWAATDKTWIAVQG